MTGVYRYLVGVLNSRPSLICGPLKCGLLSVFSLFGVGLEHKGLGLLPGEFGATKVSVAGGVLKDGAFQVQVPAKNKLLFMCSKCPKLTKLTKMWAKIDPKIERKWTKNDYKLCKKV